MPNKRKEKITHIKKYLMETVDRLDSLFHANSELSGLSTGFDNLDIAINGIQKGELLIIAANKGMGKTSLATHFASHMSIIDKVSVLYFYLEGSAELFTRRLISSLGNIDTFKMKSAMFEDTDWPRLTSVVSILSKTSLFIDNTINLDLETLIVKIRSFHATNDNVVILIDNLNFIKIKEFAFNRYEETTEISRRLKELARELNIPIILICNLNRRMEERFDKRPRLSDIRDSGCLVEFADLILFIYRDDYFNTDSEQKGITEILIPYQRSGGGNRKVNLYFHDNHLRFNNIHHEFE